MQDNTKQQEHWTEQKSYINTKSDRIANILWQNQEKVSLKTSINRLTWQEGVGMWQKQRNRFEVLKMVEW